MSERKEHGSKNGRFDQALFIKREKGAWDWKPGDSIKHKIRGAWNWIPGDSTLHYQREKGAWDWKTGDSTLHYKREK